MTYLVICVDRDNDLRVKTGIETPVIGRQKCLEAAIKLALEDATEADANTIFGAIKAYDQLKSKGEDVEIVCIGGDPLVGMISDRKIADEIDRVLGSINADRAIVVTDGADDEFILPIIQSRLKVDSVHRIVVVQSQPLETAYYQLKKALTDPRISRAIFLPIGIVFITLAIAMTFGHPEGALIPILLLLGIYAMIRAFGWGPTVERFFETARESFYGGRFSFVSYFLSGVITILGTVIGVTGALDFRSSNYLLIVHSDQPEWLLMLAEFITISVGWYTGAFVLLLIGRAIDRYLVEGQSGWGSISSISFVISLALVLWSGCSFILSAGGVVSTPQFIALRTLIVSIVAAVVISLLGIWTGRYGRRQRT